MPVIKRQNFTKTAFASLIVSAILAVPSAGQQAYAESSAKPIGQRIFEGECGFCHRATPDYEGDMLGPDLFDVIDRPAASLSNFKYSGGMRRAAKRENLTWSTENLDRFLRSPDAFIPKTRMAYPGLDIAEERQAVIDYLKTLTSQP